MFRHGFRTISTAAVITATLGIAGIATATGAAAASPDERFLTEISAEGVAFSSPEFAIGAAHAVCNDLGAGTDGVSLATTLLERTDLTTDQAVAFVVEATFAYCPEHAAALTA